MPLLIVHHTPATKEVNAIKLWTKTIEYLKVVTVTMAVLDNIVNNRTVSKVKFCNNYCNIQINARFILPVNQLRMMTGFLINRTIFFKCSQLYSIDRYK